MAKEKLGQICLFTDEKQYSRGDNLTFAGMMIAGIGFMTACIGYIMTNNAVSNNSIWTKPEYVEGLHKRLINY